MWNQSHCLSVCLCWCTGSTAQVVQTHSPDTSQLGVRGWSIEAALACSPLTHTPVSLADVERRLAVADPPLWQEYQVWGRGMAGVGCVLGRQDCK